MTEAAAGALDSRLEVVSRFEECSVDGRLLAVAVQHIVDALAERHVGAGRTGCDIATV